MVKVVKNQAIGNAAFLLELKDLKIGNAGQFYMIKITDNAMLLPRPISIFDVDAENSTVTLYIEKRGKGTELLSKLQQGDSVEVYGPFGKGFTLHDSNSILIGGACGSAPLMLLAKKLKDIYPNRKITTYLGFSTNCASLDFFKAKFEEFGEVITDVGGYITDKVDFTKDAVYYICGPVPMMKAASEKCIQSNAKAYISMENRMACGVGACLACTCKTKLGGKRVCKDGPVFEVGEVCFD